MESLARSKINEYINSLYESVDLFREEVRSELLAEQMKLDKLKDETKKIRIEQANYVHIVLKEKLDFHFKLKALMDKDGKHTEVSLALMKLVQEELDNVFTKIKAEIK